MSKMSQQPVAMSSVKLALLARKLKTEANQLSYLKSEPIAIIGMGCRFPGGSNDPNAYWHMLMNKVDAISPVPADRWDNDAWYDPEVDAPGKIATRWGGFIDQIDQFDPSFFGISPREANSMDPQQRIFMEVAYEALENAGLSLEDLSDSHTGIFSTSYHNDYSFLQYSSPTQIDGRTLTGSLHSVVPNRLSFFLNLHGPSLSLDTACSSSLVTVHLACQSLRNEECEIAIAGGINAIISPEVMISLSRVGFLSPDGRCRTFDASASGFVRGEGCGVVVLKRLADALADGDNVLAVIRGSAVNQDGRSNVLTAPNGQAHREVVRLALKNAGVSPEQIGYIEAHGTGTMLGDPIEVEALAEAIGQRPNNPDSVCVLGSVKTNMGHLESAAGIAGIIKVVLSLQNQQIPPHLHFQKLNPHISLEDTPFVIPTEARPWPVGNQPRLAGVSSLGVGGTNAHVILEEAPRLPAKPYPTEPRPYLLALSAKSAESLALMAQSHAQFLNDNLTTPLADVAYTLGARRTHFDYRLAVVGQTHEELAEKLKTFQSGAQQPNLFSGYHESGTEFKPVFVFSGQGPQWWAMGRELLAQEPIFKETIEKCDALFSQYADWSLMAELTPDEENSRLSQTEFAQPAIFALQVALATLWQWWGVKPSAVVGHSIGEVAAAHVGGALSLEDAVRVVFHRGRLMQQATGLGKMAAVEMPVSQAQDLIADYGDRLCVAAINSPTSVVFSGQTAALESVLQPLQEQGISVRMLPVNYAFHSPQMTPYQQSLTEILQGLTAKPAMLPIFSTVTGQMLEGEAFDAAYWGCNIRQPVNFAGAIQSLIKDGYNTFVEIGPHPVLGALIDQSLNHHRQQGTILASLRRKRPERASLLASLGALYAQGQTINWKNVYGQSGKLITSLPPYRWNHKRYWLDMPLPKPGLPAFTTQGIHPLLGEQLRSPAIKNTVYQTQLTADWPSFIKDHRIFGAITIPATAYLEMALAAAKTALGQQVNELQDIVIQQALLVTANQPHTVHIILDTNQSNRTGFQIHSLDPVSETWSLHVTGSINHTPALAEEPPVEVEDLQSQCPVVIPAEIHYQNSYDQGIEFGPAFQGVQAVWCNPETGQGLSKIQLPDALTGDLADYHLHPAVLDACLQTFTTALAQPENVYLPLGLKTFRVYQKPTSTMWGYVQLHPAQTNRSETRTADFYLIDDNNQLIARIEGFILKIATREALLSLTQSVNPVDEGLYEVSWQSQPLTPVALDNRSGNWLIFADEGGLSRTIVDLLQTGGQTCVTVCPGETYQVVDDSTRWINPANPPDYINLLQATPANGQSWRGIIHLWSLNLTDEHTAQPESLAISCESALYLVQALAQQKGALPRLWLATRGAQPVNGKVVVPAQAPLWGLGRTIGLEHPALNCTCLDLDPADNDTQAVVADLLSNTNENQLGYRDGSRYVARLVPFKAIDQPHDSQLAPETNPVQLAISKRGVLDNLYLAPATRRQPQAHEVEIQVEATGLNFRDVLKALDMYPGDPGPFGDECVGKIVSVGKDVTNLRVGDDVIAVVTGGFSTFTNTPTDLVIAKPSHLTSLEAATIPITFLTAYYALNRLGHLKAGDKVLIHAASGGVGMAAVQLAQRAGAEIFGTAGNPQKRDLLRSLGVQHVMDSRSLDFAGEIMDITNGQGVDVILNSLAGDFIEKSFSVLKEDGRFLEIGKTGIWDHNQVAQVKPNASYHIIYLGDVFEQDSPLVQTMLQELVAEIEAGTLKPLPFKTFPLSAVADAFRFMAQAKHIGKIVVEHPGKGANLNGHLEQPVRHDATYLITGGLGALGLVMAQGLVDNGAKHLVLTGRSAPGDAAQQTIAELEQAGAEVVVKQADVTSRSDMVALLSDIQQNLPPLKGIIHAAGIVRDGTLPQQTWPQFAQVMSPKITGTWHLHQLTQTIDLDFFVMFSSIASLWGSAGQSNYAAANAFMDTLAHYRQQHGLPAQSINWGAWDNLGMTAMLDSVGRQRWANLGINGITAQQGQELFTHILKHPSLAQPGAMLVNWTAFLRSFTSPFFTQLAPQTVQPAAEAAPAQAQQALLLKQLNDEPAARRPRIVQNYVREQTRAVLGLDATETIGLQKPLRDMGVDSLMAVELRNLLSTGVDSTLPATLIFDYPTIAEIADYLQTEILKIDTEPAEIEASPQSVETPAEIIDLDDISDEEAEAMLLAELNHTTSGKLN